MGPTLQRHPFSGLVPDKNLIDIGNHVGSVATVGRYLASIFERLISAAKRFEGTILPGNRKLISTSRTTVEEFKSIYASFAGYHLSNSLGSLLTGFDNALVSTIRPNVTLNNTLIITWLQVNEDLINNVGDLWKHVFPLRFLGISGINFDVTLDYELGSFHSNYAKFKDYSRELLNDAAVKSGQLCGLRIGGQQEFIGLVSDLIFSRNPSGVSLFDVGLTGFRNRTLLSEFRTDLLFTPVNLFGELVRPFWSVVSVNETTGTKVCTVSGFDFIEYYLINHTLSGDLTVSYVGKKGGSASTILIKPLDHVTVYAYSFTNQDHLGIIARANWITHTATTGSSIVELFLEGKLTDAGNAQYCKLFLDVMNCVGRELCDFITQLKNDPLTKLVLQTIYPAGLTALNDLDNWGLLNAMTKEITDKKKRLFLSYIAFVAFPEALSSGTFGLKLSGNAPYLRVYQRWYSQLQGIFSSG